MTSSWIAFYQAVPAAYWIVCSGTLVNRLGSFIIPLQMVYLTQERALSREVAALLLSMQGIGMLLANLLGGVLADRFGRRTTMACGLSLGALSMGMMWFAHSLVFIGVSTMLIGLTADLHRPAAQAYVSDLIPDEGVRTQGFGLLNWASNCGGILAMLIASALMPSAFGLLFALDGATSLAFAAMTWFGLREIATRAHVAAPLESGAGALLKYPRLIASVLCLIGAFTLYFQRWATLPFAIRAAGLQPDRFSLLLAANAGVVAIGQLVLLGPMKRWPVVLTVAAAYALVGFGVALFGAAGSFAGFLGAVTVVALGEIALGALGPALMLRWVPDDMRGRALGLFGLAISGGMLLAPLAGTALYQRNPLWLWQGCALGGLALAAVQLLIAREGSGRTRR